MAGRQKGNQVRAECWKPQEGRVSRKRRACVGAEGVGRVDCCRRSRRRRTESNLIELKEPLVTLTVE